MGTTKQVSNHQLGMALASIIEKSEKQHQHLLLAQQSLLERIEKIEQSMDSKLHRLEHMDISPNLIDLRSLEREINNSANIASEIIKKSLKSFILSNTVIAIWIIPIIVSIGISIYSLSEVQKSKQELGNIQNFSKAAAKFFNENPKIYQQFQKQGK